MNINTKLDFRGGQPLLGTRSGVAEVLPPKWGSPTVSAPQDAYPARGIAVCIQQSPAGRRKRCNGF